MQSGWANFGNAVSGLYNTSVLGLNVAAFNSGIANVGSRLAGLFVTGTGS
jgi:hypothetical protein